MQIPPDTQICLPDFNHPSNTAQQYYLPTSQSIHNQDINHLQHLESHVAIPSQSHSQVPTQHVQEYHSSPQSPAPITRAGPDPTTNSRQSSPLSTRTRRSPTAVTTTTPADHVADKRRRNTLAARRFRQKQHDRVAELERALESVCKERDELKMQAARWEGEVVALRGMLRRRNFKD
ncbi:bZIP family transcription factor [Histoplasma capsulatum G186AR]|nr:bZIP family transcription factor [Histoplasma capsulatum]QSS67495.1 bZIP family transcription factor [Histoplasma capsulatum G186AR]